MEVKLKGEKRDGAGKGVARKVRATGKVPAILYGGGIDPLTLTVESGELWHALHTDAGSNVLIDLAVDGQNYLTMPREVQRDIVRGSILHVDFLRIRKDVAIQVDVPVHLTGESTGVKQGGVVEHHLWELRVECLPTEVPESIVADISKLDIGDALYLRDLRIPGNVTVLTPEDEIIVSVVPPPVLKLEEEVPEEEAAAEEAAEGEEGAPAEGEEGAPAAEGQAPAGGEEG
jgi:large subunit ribosomal protein L25